MQFDRLTAEMRRLALAAGHAIMEIYEAEDMGVEAKADASPVTRADMAADRIIADGLARAFPDVLIVTEEQAATHAERAERFLIVDPLDGTKEFVQRRGGLHGQHRAGGGAACPCAASSTRRPRGGSSTPIPTADRWRRRAPSATSPGETAPVRVSRPDNDALNVVASKSHRDAATDDYIGRYSVADTRSAGSSLKFCLVATGGGGSLSAARAHDGVGHRRRPCGAGRRGPAPSCGRTT